MGTRVTRTARELQLFNKERVDLPMLLSRCLIQSIQSHMKFANMVRLGRILTPLQLLHVYVLISIAIQKRSYHIHLVQLQVLLRNQQEEDANGSEFRNRSIRLILSHPFHLLETTRNQMCL